MFQERQGRGKEAEFQIMQSKDSVLCHSDELFLVNFLSVSLGIGGFL